LKEAPTELVQAGAQSLSVPDLFVQVGLLLVGSVYKAVKCFKCDGRWCVQPFMTVATRRAAELQRVLSDHEHAPAAGWDTVVGLKPPTRTMHKWISLGVQQPMDEPRTMQQMAEAQPTLRLPRHLFNSASREPKPILRALLQLRAYPHTAYVQHGSTADGQSLWLINDFFRDMHNHFMTVRPACQSVSECLRVSQSVSACLSALWTHAVASWGRWW
jgi:hypothetical protein